jgi:hypothetical protein
MLFAAEEEVSNRNCLVRQSGNHQGGFALNHSQDITCLDFEQLASCTPRPDQDH